MAKVFDGIDDKLDGWISRQHVFFVGTAPMAADGSINVSPKGMSGTFAVLGPRRVGLPRLHRLGHRDSRASAGERPHRDHVLRLRGATEDRQTAWHRAGATPGDPDFGEIRPAFEKSRTIGQRSIIVVDLNRISDSCGYSVPLMDFRGDRDILDKSQERRDEAYITDYQRTHNTMSIDGLPGLPARA